MKPNRLLVPMMVVLTAPLARAEGVKVAIVPFAALSGDVPQRAGAKAAGMLATELKNTEGLQISEAKKPSGGDPRQELLERARQKVAEAREHRAKKKFRLAEEALTQALADFRAAASVLTEVGEVIDAYALLSAVQYNTGRDEDGRKNLVTALAMGPSRELPLAATSPLFGRLVQELRAGVQLGPKGSLLIESSPPSAAVFVDGVAVGSTPVRVKGVPAGLHVWKVALPSGENAGGVVEIAGTSQVKVSGQAAGKDPESKLLARLSENKLDPEVIAAAKQQLAASEADLLIFGALSREGKQLALDGFLLGKAKGDVRRLPRMRFDTELLSAGMEMFNFASQLKEKGAQLGEPARIPGTVTPGPLPKEAEVAEAQYGFEAGKDLALDSDPAAQPSPQQKSSPRAPLRRTPLKKQ